MQPKRLILAKDYHRYRVIEQSHRGRNFGKICYPNTTDPDRTTTFIASNSCVISSESYPAFNTISFEYGGIEYPVLFVRGVDEKRDNMSFHIPHSYEKIVMDAVAEYNEYYNPVDMSEFDEICKW